MMKPTPIALVLLLASIIANGQQPNPTELGKRIDKLADEALARPTAGISIAIARNGQVIFAHGYGMANLEHAVAATPETVFHICSISKNILAAVLLQLVEERKLKLDDDVKTYVPEASTHGRQVTIRQLLNHTSGIFSFTSLPNADRNERLDLTHDQVLALFKDQPLDFEPGTKWRYNNSAFYLAGMVVERITRQDYGAYALEHLFKPLGMNSARLCDARTITPHLASGYERDHGALVNAQFLSWKLPFAAGAVCMTARDLLTWQAALDAGRVLSASSLQLMRTRTMLSDNTAVDYGLGTRLGAVDGHRVLGHTGSGGGFGTVLESFPDDHVTIAVLMNTGNGAGPAVALATSIARLMLGMTEQKTLQDLPVPPEELAALAGASFDSDEGPVENFARDGKLHFRIPGAQIEGGLRRQAPNIYALENETEIHFLVRDGRATWANVYVGGLFMDAKYRLR